MMVNMKQGIITMRAPDNWHVHFREGLLMEFLIPIFIYNGWQHRLVAEPNLKDPILTGEHAIRYGMEIEKIAHKVTGGKNFRVVVTIQITETTTAETIRDAWARGVRVCKVYPRYVTTNSEHGVVDYTLIYPALAECEKVGMIVQFHPEHPSYDVIGRLKEHAFIAILSDIRLHFPKLKISVEHVSSKVMIDWVLAQDEYVGAGLTIQHMLLTSDDLTGYSKMSKGKICVHYGYKPLAKDPIDREAVISAATSGNPKFWYGGDDAAHLKSAKHSGEAPCGAWNTEAAIPLMIGLFISRGCLGRLEAFLSEYGARFYGYDLNKETITFERKSRKIPAEVAVPALNDSIVPFWYEQDVDWCLMAA